MISIQITCPFRYKYNGTENKDIFFMSGEYYHLDEVKDKNEIKKILSPSFEFKEYMYVNIETIPEELLQNSRLESGNSFHSNPNPEEVEYVSTLVEGTKSTQELKDPGPDYDEPLTKDAEDNFFATQIDNQKLSKESKEPKEEKPDLGHKELEEQKKKERIEKDKNQGALNTPDYSPEEAKEIVEEATTFEDGEKEARRKELDELHYTKIQDVAEQYHIEYTKKDETINKILEAEFSVQDNVKELEGQYKTDEDLKE